MVSVARLQSRFDARERIPDLSQVVAFLYRYRLEVVYDHADEEIQGDESAKKDKTDEVDPGEGHLFEHLLHDRHPALKGDDTKKSEHALVKRPEILRRRLGE